MEFHWSSLPLSYIYVVASFISMKAKLAHLNFHIGIYFGMYRSIPTWCPQTKRWWSLNDYNPAVDSPFVESLFAACKRDNDSHNKTYINYWIITH